MSNEAVERWTRVLGKSTRAGNAVTYLIDGPRTFEAMHEAINTAKRRGHYIYLLGWWFDRFVSLTGEKKTGLTLPSSATALLQLAGKNGVQIRLMLWDQVGGANGTEVNWVNGIANGAGILDNRTVPIWPELDQAARARGGINIERGPGSHHQKVLIVRGERGLVAFCGGVDINEDRVAVVKTSVGSPYHDVHCRIEGPAAHGLVDVFVQRWLAHPEHCKIDAERGALVGLQDRVAANRPTKGAQHVRIGRNFNFVTTEGNCCAKEQSIRTILTAAILEAQRFIYIEDQYLVCMDAAKALKQAIPRIQHLTIVIPHPSTSDLPDVWQRQLEFIRELQAAEGGETKARVFCRLGTDGALSGPNSYVHAKTWIFDDELAVIGSANCNNRGWSHDSEVIAAIFDRPPSLLTAPSFAQELRMLLWKDHLGLAAGEMSSILLGWGESARRWVQATPQAGMRIKRYDPNEAHQASIAYSVKQSLPLPATDPSAAHLRACDETVGCMRCR